VFFQKIIFSTGNACIWIGRCFPDQKLTVTALEGQKKKNVFFAFLNAFPARHNALHAIWVKKISFKSDRRPGFEPQLPAPETRALTTGLKKATKSRS
jgi:hypothetical protein